MEEKDVQRLIDMLYNMIDEAKSAAFSAEKCTINRDEALDILDEMRSKLPLELKKAKELIAKESYDPQYGARPIKRYLQKHVENELASMIIRGDLLDGGSVTIDSDGTNLTFKA